MDWLIRLCMKANWSSISSDLRDILGTDLVVTRQGLEILLESRLVGKGSCTDLNVLIVKSS